jgi:hypothetical protein
VTPGGLASLQAKVGIVVVVLFLFFGLVFGYVVLRETPDSESGLKLLISGFFLIWVVVCIIIIVIFLRVLSKKKHLREKSLVNLSIEETAEQEATKNGDFESRLRMLEQLKRDGLITEEEYQMKRAQILGDKW